ncbi:hypothetical protein EVAR_64339_1 [Eumeta japonica]|uniref:Uncharacterized protein n=1 Tax=Eumeta variegata TaxID=151549 RepID=A0A4C1ZM01_EUMVA|nr:hypothetical protein EVAR_64339_1 [Eumeta japonica]
MSLYGVLHEYDNFIEDKKYYMLRVNDGGRVTSAWSSHKKVLDVRLIVALLVVTVLVTTANYDLVSESYQRRRQFKALVLKKCEYPESIQNPEFQYPALPPPEDGARAV